MICINCGEPLLKRLFNAPAFDSPQLQYPLARCSACKLVNTMQISQEILSEAYSNEYYGAPGKKFSSLIERLIGYLHKLQANTLLHTWLQNKPVNERPSVLDIGCGRGLLLSAFQSLGADIQGIERDTYTVSESMLSYVKVGAISDPEYTGKSYDIIVLWHVLEHLNEPEALIKKLLDHLNEDSLLVVAVPNFDSIQRSIFRQQWFHLDVPRHLVHFETPWLLERLQTLGFSIEEVRHFDFTQNIYGFIQSSLNCMFPKRANQFYQLLKGDLWQNFVILCPWLLVSTVLLPFAILESLLGVITKRGATITIVARPKKND